MAILVETSSVKQYTGITSTTYDDFITDMETIVLDDIVHYCKNSFVRSTQYYWTDLVSFSTSTGLNTILSSDTEYDYTEFFAAGNAIKVVDSFQNNAYYSVNEVGTTYIIVNESITSETSSTGKFPTIWRVDFPKDLPFIASRMISYQIDVQGKSGLISESLGDYSYTLGDTLAGSNSYPSNVLNGLTKYRKMRML